MQTPVCLVPPVKAGHQHPSVHHQRRQAPSRTLRSASPTIRSTSPALPRLGRAALRATASSLRVGGLIGRTSSPSSPRSNTLTGPPRPKPTRSHQSWGKTDCRFSDKVMVVAFITVKVSYRSRPVKPERRGSGDSLRATVIGEPSIPKAGQHCRHQADGLCRRATPRLAREQPCASRNPERRSALPAWATRARAA